MIQKPTYEELENLVKELKTKCSRLEQYKAESDKREQDLESLLESENLYRQVVDTISDGLAICDADGRIVFANSALCEMYRYSNKQILQMHALQLIHPDYHSVFERFLNELIETGSFQGETVDVRSDGTTFHTDVRGARIDYQGQECFLAVIRDTTDRWETEETLKRYAHIISATDDLMSFVDKNYIYRAVNNAYLTAHNRSVEEIVGLSVEELMGREAFQSKAKEFLDRSLSGETVRYQSWFNYAGIGPCFMDVVYHPFKDSKGGISGVVVCVHDLTERRKAEEALRASEQRLQAILEANPDPMVFYDKQGFPQYLNPAFSQVFGWSFEEVKGRRVPFVPDDQKQITMAKITEAYDSGAPVSFVTKRLTKQNDTIEVIISAATIKGPGGEALGMVVNLTDISRQRKLEAQLQQAQKMESIGRLAGGVAHDFNNMLGVILGHADLAMQHVYPKLPVFNNLTKISKAASHSADLTRQLLAFARRQTAIPKVLDLNDTISGMLKMLRRLIGEDIDLVWVPGAALQPVKFDPTQVDQILANLCVNARDAITGIGNITIETSTAVLDEAYCEKHAGFVPGRYTSLTVSDNGCGMDKKTLEKIFEPFFTTKDTGEGTGLGMAMVYGIVKQNNGFINVYSEPGRGSSVKIYLPITHEAAEPPKEAAKTEIPKGSETILVVEDEISILELIEAALQQFGYTVFTATRPSEAIALAQKHKASIDMLVTDLVMPEMNGRDLKLRIEAYIPNIKVLFMSGYTTNVIMHQGILEKDIHFLQKPFPVDSLAGKIREVLDEPSERTST